MDLLLLKMSTLFIKKDIFIFFIATLCKSLTRVIKIQRWNANVAKQ